MSLSRSQIKWMNEDPADYEGEPFFVKVGKLEPRSSWDFLEGKIIVVMKYSKTGKYKNLRDMYSIMRHIVNDSLDTKEWPSHYYQNSMCIRRDITTLYVPNNNASLVAMKKEIPY